MIPLDDDGFADLSCAFTGTSGHGVLRLSDVVLLEWPGADRVGCCETAAEVFRDAVALAADCGAHVPQCVFLLGGELQHATESRPHWTPLGRLREAVTRRLGDGAGGSVLRAICGCETCMTLRKPDGYAEMLGEHPGMEFPGHQDELSAAERDPVLLSDVTMPLVRFVKSLNPDQRVITPDGVTMRAADFVRTIYVPRRDARGRVVKRKGNVVTEPVDIGAAIDAARAGTAYPGAGPLSRSAMPRAALYGPHVGHGLDLRWLGSDPQLERRGAALDAEWSDFAGQPAPSGHVVAPHPETCEWCGAPAASRSPGGSRPLVVLCPHCERDRDAVRAEPGGWRYIVQPGHGLESRIGRTRMSSAVGRNGEPIFDLTTVNPGYRPFVLSILPADLLAHDRHGEVLPVSEWIARILQARKP